MTLPQGNVYVPADDTTSEEEFSLTLCGMRRDPSFFFYSVSYQHYKRNCPFLLMAVQPGGQHRLYFHFIRFEILSPKVSVTVPHLNNHFLRVPFKVIRMGKN